MFVRKISEGISNRENSAIRYNVETAVVLLRRLYAHVQQDEPALQRQDTENYDDSPYGSNPTGSTF